MSDCVQRMRYERLSIAGRHVALSVKRSELEGDEVKLGTAIGVLTSLACVIWNMARFLSTRKEWD